ncbi:aminotransferase class I/II-fold pyridoxal phosphate-dependent enzyme [Actinophytocola sp. KF-1]
MLTARPAAELLESGVDFPAALRAQVLAALAATPWRRYPEPSDGLRARIAAHYGVAAANVLPTRGCREAVELAFAWAVRAGAPDGVSTLALPRPSWSGFVPAAERAGAVWSAYDAGTPPPPDRIPVLCTPNNPTGHVTGYADLARLCAPGALPAVVDCTYDDLADQPVLPAVRGLLTGRGVFCASLAKSTGLAAARLGVLIAAEDVVAAIEAAAGPFGLDAFQVAALDVLFSDAGRRAWRDMVALARAVRAECAGHAAALLPCGTVGPAVGGVVYARFADPCAHVSSLVEATGATVFPRERVLRFRADHATVHALAALRGR